MNVNLTSQACMEGYKNVERLAIRGLTIEARHIEPPCNKSGISKFGLGFQEYYKFQVSFKSYSSLKSYRIILNILTREIRHIVLPNNKAGISNFLLESQEFSE